MNHRDQVLALLSKQVGSPTEVRDIQATAEEVRERWINPSGSGAAQTNGLIYGLVQSGKTGVLTVTGAIAADDGYKSIIILTSDIDPLYVQTLGRAQEAFPGMEILGKHDIKDQASFVKRIKVGPCVIVATKNASILNSLIENFKSANVRGMTCLVIDDEADQASLNTKAKKDDGSRSSINNLIIELRTYFSRNTYLQVTATPQALFLQTPNDKFRPKFTVLSHPGADYVGGEDFFGVNAKLVRQFPLNEIEDIGADSQPAAQQYIPPSLLRALDTFMIAATHKRVLDAEANCAFLCHVSTRTSDHKHLVLLMRKYKNDLATGLQKKNKATVNRLMKAYDDLATTHKPLAQTPFDDLIDKVRFFSAGTQVKLVNGESDEDVEVRAPINLFVGGNKLGRGVTIKNLLVSYYGRNPRAPQADTVLQHARMYGYRRKDIGLLRLFLPAELDTVFRAIYKMETSLRELIANRPPEDIRCLYIERSIKATRRNVIAPGAVGVYTAGSSFNPSLVRRTPDTRKSADRIDAILKDVENGTYVELPIEVICSIIELTNPDIEVSEHLWDSDAIVESLRAQARLSKQGTGYVYVDRNRSLTTRRRESQGILSGGESQLVPGNRNCLFILRMKERGTNAAAWWPQVRFSSGNYAFAFAI